ncbi:hypothetical protein QH73_0019995 [Scytonema millei VB511283]|uniref:Uncharacterized protein n=2 Tax=Scytonema TaxID=1203 RepID=A0A9X5E8S7_9CYAN|nr:DUF6516 family protein [Scytonema millei]NHC36888.1 hypothetical protein [Scytonema millei VB511283]
MRTGIKHQPNRFRSYQEIHSTVISQFKARDFIGAETLYFESIAYGISLAGEIACLGNIVVSVQKFIEILDGSGDNALVQTKWYSYNVFIRGQYNIFRYDNQDDGFLRPDHQDEHHKHIFDWKTGEELPNSPVWLGEDNWLTLGEVLQEVEDWYWQNREKLAKPDIYPELDLR